MNTALVRDAVKEAIIRVPSLHVYGEADSLPALRIMQTPNEPWVLLVSGSLTGLASFDDLMWLVRPESRALLVILTRRELDRQRLMQALAIGPRAMVGQELPLDDLVNVLKLVGRGMAVFPADQIMESLNCVPSRLGENGDNHLSEREQQTLQFLAEGCSEAEVAMRLGVGLRTVHTYLERARAKLGAANRVHAVAMALAARQIGINHN